MKRLFLVVTLPLLTFIGNGIAASQTSGPAIEIGTVTQVVDGDTIDVQIIDPAGNSVYRVRYIGINTPEYDQPCGSEATAANTALVGGKTVAMLKDVSETDRYDRLLRYVYVGGIFVNAALVADGWAESVHYPPDTLFASWFDALDAGARAANLGCHPFGVFAGAPLAVTSTPALSSGQQQPSTEEPTPSGAQTWNCSGNRYNCSHFSTCDELMSYWNTCPGDPSRLDGDHDGKPCESLCGG